MTTKSKIPNSAHSKNQPINLSWQSATDGKRKVGRPSNMNDSVRAAIVFLHQDCKIGKRKLANRLGLGVGTVLKVLSEA